MANGMRTRTTADLVVIFLTGVVGFVVIVSTIGVIFAEIFHPGADTSRAVARIATLVSSMVTGIIGYIAGKGTERKNGNGAH